MTGHGTGKLVMVTLISAEGSSASWSPEVPANLRDSLDPTGYPFLAKTCYHPFILKHTAGKGHDSISSPAPGGNGKRQAGLDYKLVSGVCLPQWKCTIHDKFQLELDFASGAWKDSQLPTLKVVLKWFPSQQVHEGATDLTGVCYRVCDTSAGVGEGRKQEPSNPKAEKITAIQIYSPSVWEDTQSFIFGGLMPFHFASSQDCSAAAFVEEPNPPGAGAENTVSNDPANIGCHCTRLPQLIFAPCFSHLLPN
ncbi:hypothetical protein WISP_134051 [Willisornis vidua]|uniref:Uncharacterized protein n=1 Tax=Willisornis vidua TaxID=1566151 RepID=A0ABQ9CNX4_9PASS|nr:hypothetical protein WISP_134051 [Willisornis vidua]